MSQLNTHNDRARAEIYSIHVESFSRKNVLIYTVRSFYLSLKQNSLGMKTNFGLEASSLLMQRRYFYDFCIYLVLFYKQSYKSKSLNTKNVKNLRAIDILCSFRKCGKRFFRI